MPKPLLLISVIIASSPSRLQRVPLALSRYRSLLPAASGGARSTNVAQLARVILHVGQYAPVNRNAFWFHVREVLVPALHISQMFYMQPISELIRTRERSL